MKRKPMEPYENLWNVEKKVELNIVGGKCANVLSLLCNFISILNFILNIMNCYASLGVRKNINLAISPLE
jgi:hypothetical protein